MFAPVKFPSISKTSWPCLARDTPRFDVNVVLPTPPFPDTTDMTRVISVTDSTGLNKKPDYGCRQLGA
ncbi:hypothetical protein SVXNc_0124 [Candidatus Nanohalococcus occultus]|uniref:Uncharacterized protein n=1 Tax=Candidatus Nanohalococcus occultus TaxID=2978047 RepID=A0ABY8CD57_9ARCH|nr:hypothetical protein SVXNc_0124 [Candidatus Nanohaloarchaeota archaeon SVXNc]